ncbi:hypothetical protein N865_18755 [Intrasporangium oryzae NRRL B-24470]|uniref:Uncharacterized protein n=1 Tax=Intrasporangium oryzae NRRL B-24470 TaxID=1386089 RepID=W9GAY3_9MICO|nr:hypothetical protein N865_18755 [Intrasporangium oryzae NRRL B-24470]
MGWSRLTFLREPAVPLLVLATAVMVTRGYAADILLCVGTLALVVREGLRWRGRTADATPAPLRWRSVAGGCAIATVLGVGLSLIPRTERWLDVALAAVGVLALWLSLAVGPGGDGHLDDAPEPVPASPPRWWVWLGIGALLVLIELVSFLSQSDARTDNPDRPTISTLLEPTLAAGVPRAAGLTLWLLAGWWLVRRTRAWSGSRAGAP